MLGIQKARNIKIIIDSFHKYQNSLYWYFNIFKTKTEMILKNQNSRFKI